MKERRERREKREAEEKELKKGADRTCASKAVSREEQAPSD